MNVGFVSFYSYRPHVEHMEYLARGLSQLGHETFYLICQGGLLSCNNSLGNSNIFNRKLNCLTCHNMGLASYGSGEVKIIPSKREATEIYNEIHDIEVGVRSSLISSMKINFEFNKVSDHPEFNNLRNASYAQFHGLCSQIAQLKIDKLIIFNGRLDFTAAAVGAAKKMGIDFHTVERSWLGYGLNITHQGVPLDLAPYRQVIKSNLGTELTEQQQRLSKLTLSRRVTKQSNGEFQQFNLSNSGSPRKNADLLYCPSSLFERALHKDLAPHFSDVYALIEEIAKHLGIKFSQVTVRAHPSGKGMGWILTNFTGGNV